jgi:hypothetical protein
MTTKNSKKIVLLYVIGFVLVALMVAAVVLTKPDTQKGAKEIVVVVDVPDQDSQDFIIDTDAEFLSQALEEQDLIKGTESDYGLFITEVNGITADDTKQEWWCITKDGADVMTGADQTPIADGDHYEITLKTGY